MESPLFKGCKPRLAGRSSMLTSRFSEHSLLISKNKAQQGLWGAMGWDLPSRLQIPACRHSFSSALPVARSAWLMRPLREPPHPHPKDILARTVEQGQ